MTSSLHVNTGQGNEELSRPGAQKYLFVVNPIAGSRGKDEFIDLLEERPWPSRPHVLWTEPTTADSLEAILQLGRYDGVVAVGGDGTVHMVAEIAQMLGIPLGIVPMGSGNGLAKDLNLPLDIEDALDLILDGRIRYIDRIDFNNKACYHICDAGLNAKVVQEYAQGSYRTVRAYAWHLLRYYFSADPTHTQVWVDGRKVYTDTAYMVAVCNGRRFGSDIYINPGGNPSDGLLEVVIVKDFPKTAGPSILLDLIAGELPFDYITVFRGMECRFEVDHPWPWQVDGEFEGLSQSFQAQIRPGVLAIFS